MTTVEIQASKKARIEEECLVFTEQDAKTLLLSLVWLQLGSSGLSQPELNQVTHILFYLSVVNKMFAFLIRVTKYVLEAFRFGEEGAIFSFIRRGIIVCV